MRKLKFFLVDDTEYIRFILKKMLKSSKIFEAEIIGEAEDGREAIEKLKLLKPDIVTLDITMPIMNGLEAVKEIKKNSPEIKVLMVTVLGDKDKVLRAIQNGADGYMLKPFKQEKVFKAIKELMAEDWEELEDENVESLEKSEKVMEKN